MHRQVYSLVDNRVDTVVALEYGSGGDIVDVAKYQQQSDDTNSRTEHLAVTSPFCVCYYTPDSLNELDVWRVLRRYA